MNKNNLTKSKIVRAGLMLTFIGGVSLVATPSIVHAETSQEISVKKEKADNEIEKFKKNLKKTEKKISKKTKEFEKAELEIEEVGEDIAKTEERIEKRQDIIRNRMSSYQTNETGGVNMYITAIFGSDSFTDLITRINLVGTIIDADASIVEAQTKDKDELEKNKQTLLYKRMNLEKQFQELQEAFVELETQKEEQELLSAQLGEELDDALEKEERINRLQELQRQNFEKDFVSSDLPSNVKTTKKGSKAIDEASKYLGGKYVWGGSNPKTSFDCSGYTQWSFGEAGIDIPRTAAQQYLHTDRISASELQAGDLVFFSYGKGIAHVGIYIGDGKMMNAQNSGIMVADLKGYWSKYIAGYGRVPGVEDK